MSSYTTYDVYDRAISAYNHAMEIFRESWARKSTKGFKAAMDIFETTIKAFTFVLEEFESQPEERDMLLSNLSNAYYMKGACRYNVDGHPGDAVLKDYLKALDLDGQKLMRNPKAKADMTKLLYEAFEGLYYAGEYKRGLVVCYYIEKYIDAEIAYDPAYKSIKADFETGSPLIANMKNVAKKFSGISTWVKVGEFIDDIFS